MAVHIGKVIKNRVKQKGIGVTKFADKINYSRRNVYEIFERESIDTGLLLKIGKVLDENLFFHFITEDEIQLHKNEKTIKNDLMGVLNEIKGAITSKKQKVNSPKKSSKKKKG